MTHYEISVKQHRNLQNKLGPPIYSVFYIVEGEVIYTSHDEGVAKDVKYLLNKARAERLAKTESKSLDPIPELPPSDEGELLEKY